MAKLIPISNLDWGNLKQHIEDGKLFSFPTETVYGLGANAFDSAAVERIFTTKKRPFSDPVIAHVSTIVQAEPLLKLSVGEQKIFSVLAQHFWPGPLTIIGRASKLVPAIVTGSTGMVGIRIPNHKFALKLLDQLGLPIAAPSANIFGHISPTTAAHVCLDFQDENELLVLDAGPCSVGVESTIVKIESDSEICYLRPGAIGIEQLRIFFEGMHLKIKVTDKAMSVASEKIESSGSRLSHYAPSQPCFMLSSATVPSQLEKFDLGVLDFGMSNLCHSHLFAGYSDISPSKNLEEAVYNFYNFLRTSEKITKVKKIVLIDPRIFYPQHHLALCLADRMIRASSGNVI